MSLKRRRLRSPEDETPCPFPARLVRRDESLRGWEENPLFVAFTRRAAHEGRRGRGPLAASGLVLGLGAVMIASFAAFFIIGWAAILVLIAGNVLVYAIHEGVPTREAKLPATLSDFLVAPGKQPATDIWMTGNSGGVIAEALYLEQRAASAGFSRLLPLLSPALLVGLYTWMRGGLWPWDIVPVGALALVALSMPRWLRETGRVGAWLHVEGTAVERWEVGSGSQRGCAAVLGGAGRALLEVAVVFALAAAGLAAGSLAARHLGARFGVSPRTLFLPSLTTTMSLAAIVFLHGSAWVLRRREAGVRERVLRRAEFAWDHYVVTRVLDPSEDARRWSAERHKAWEAAAAERKNA